MSKLFNSSKRVIAEKQWYERDITRPVMSAEDQDRVRSVERQSDQEKVTYTNPVGTKDTSKFVLDKIRENVAGVEPDKQIIHTVKRCPICTRLHPETPSIHGVDFERCLGTAGRGFGKHGGACKRCLENNAVDPSNPTAEELKEAEGCKGDDGQGWGKHRVQTPDDSTIETRKDPLVVFDSTEDALRSIMDKMKEDNDRRSSAGKRTRFPIKMVEEPLGVEIALDPTAKNRKNNRKKSSIVFNAGKVPSLSEMNPEEYDRDNPEIAEREFIEPSDVTAPHEDYVGSLTGEDSLARMLNIKSCTKCGGRGCPACKSGPIGGDEDFDNETAPNLDDDEDFDNETAPNLDDDEYNPSADLASEGTFEKNMVTCPEPPIGCGGWSRHNNHNERIYTSAHCPGSNCKSQDCGSSNNDESSHCIGCRDTQSCPGRPWKEWSQEVRDNGKTKKITVCPTCLNAGEVTPEVADEATRGVPIKSPKKMKKKFKERPTDIEETDSLPFDISNVDDYKMGQGAEALPTESSKKSGLTLAEMMKDRATNYRFVDDDDEVPTSSAPAVPKEATHNFCGCSKRNGEASESQIMDIMANRKTNGYNEGIATIKRTVPSGEQPERIRQFIKEQYACKGDDGQ